MLMDFQIERGRAATTEIFADVPSWARDRLSTAHEARTFEISAPLWWAMFTCYAVFFGALIAATGRGTAAVFALVVSIGYTFVYFGTASILNRVSAPERAALPSIAADAGMQTYTGWMSGTAVIAQILIVPISLALFACAFAVVRAMV